MILLTWIGIWISPATAQATDIFHEGVPRILFVASQDSEIHQSAYAPLRRGLAYPPPLFISADDTNAAQWIGHFDCRDCMIVTSGTRALQDVLNFTQQARVLSFMIPMESHERLIRSVADQERFAALYMDIPLEKRMLIARRHVPALRRFSVVESQPQSQTDTGTPVENLQYFVKQPDQNLLDVFIQAARHSDAILTLPDREIYNPRNIVSIMMTTYRLGTPLIGHSEALHRAGALISIYAEPEMLGEEALAVIRGQAREGWKALRRHTELYQVSVNHQVARSLRITVEAP
ncbi:hypothetical protein CKO35_07315 [Ectothiorhodospira shaposhnikovii]|nr:hypothetical protein [Ectothiorhodospira shaposhnikovii]